MSNGKRCEKHALNALENPALRDYCSWIDGRNSVTALTAMFGIAPMDKASSIKGYSEYISLVRESAAKSF